jgi:chromate reductase, NAD(P)H dehydrogenase (quinone)
MDENQTTQEDTHSLTNNTLNTEEIRVRFETPTPLHFLGISGSLRRGSFNTQLLHIASAMLPEGVTMEMADLNLPLYNEDLRDKAYPETVETFRQKIRIADALLIACPEYNYSVTGVLKNAIDWASRPDIGDPASSPAPLNAKPVGLMGVGHRHGTINAQHHLRQIAIFTNMHILNRPEVIISNSPSKAFDENNNLIDPVAVKQLGDLLIALREWTRQLKK